MLYALYNTLKRRIWFRKKKKRIEALIELKKEAIDKFIITSNKSKFENIGDCSLNEHINNEHIDENENREEILVNGQINNVVIDENEDSEEILLVNEQYYIDSQTQN